MNVQRAGILLWAVGLSGVGAQEFRSYVGANNTVWESPTNWNPNLVPDTVTEGARLGNGSTVNVGGSHLIQALEITAGSLTVNQGNELRTNTLLISGAGVLAGPGSLVLEQSGSIVDSSGVNFSNLVFRNNGDLQLVLGIALSSDSVFENVNSLTLADGASISLASGSPDPTPGPILNTGFVRKVSGTGNASIGAPIENDEEIFSGEGTLILSGDLQHRDRLRTDAGGVISLRGGATLFDGSQIAGDGTTEFRTGTYTVPTAATVTFDNVDYASAFTMTGGGVVEHEGTSNTWSAGSMQDTLVNRVVSGAVVSISGNGMTFEDATGVEVEAGGRLVFTQDGSSITSNGTTTFLNEGTVEFASDGDIFQNGPYDPQLMTFSNAAGGAVVKSAGNGGVTQFVAKVESSGSWQVNAGRMDFFRETGFSAPLDVASGAEVVFDGGTSFLRDGAALTGGGSVKLRDTTEVSGGSVNASTPLILDGTLAGDGRLVCSAACVWDSGSLGGTVEWEISPTGSVVANDSSSRTVLAGESPLVDNQGEFLFGGSANLSSNGMARIENSGTLTFTETGGLSTNAGVDTELLNTGALVKEAGTGTGTGALSRLTVELEHHGTMEVRSGILDLRGDHVIAAPIDVSSGAVFRLDGSGVASFEAGAEVRGDGVFEHRGADVRVAAGARVAVENYETPFGSGVVGGTGTFVFASGGVVSRFLHEDAGTTEIPAGVELEVTGNFRPSGGRRLRVLGELTVNTGFTQAATGGFSIENDGTVEFLVGGNMPATADVSEITNDGLIRFAVPASSTVSLPIDVWNGSGAVEVVSGRLSPSKAVAFGNDITVASGAKFRSNGLTLAAGSRLSGGGLVENPITVSGTVAPGSSVGTLAFGGQTSFTGSAVYEVELGNGTNDLIDAGSSVVLGGLRLRPSLLAGATPAVETSWTILEDPA